MSIIPPIETPQIEPNVARGTPFSGTLTVAQNQVLYGVGSFSGMYSSDHDDVYTVDIAGTVWSAPRSDVATAIGGFYIRDIIVSGIVAAEGSAAYSEFGQGNAYALFVGGAGRSVTNSGTIYAVTDVGLAVGLTHYESVVAINNSGVIAARTGSVVVDHGSIMQALAIAAFNGAYLHNAASGQILAEGINATAIILGRGHPHYPPNAMPDTPPEILNDGVIKAASLDPGFESVGILAAHLEQEVLRIVNNGLIEADVAIREQSATWPYTAAHGWIMNGSTGTIRGDIESELGNATLTNLGVIEGDAWLGLGSDQVINSGRIVGDVSLDGDADVYDGRLGTLVGTVLGGDGSDLIMGGAGRDRLDGGAGADVLFAHGGDTLTGGTGSDTFVFTSVVAGAAAETITDFASGSDRIDLRGLAPSSVTISGTTVTAVTAGGALTIEVGGALTLADILSNPATTGPTGTDGDDALVAGPQGAVLLGGAGADVLVGGAGNDRLDGGTGVDRGDLMVGGAGDDTYAVDDELRDVVVEEAGGGFDTIELAAGLGWLWTPYILPGHVERVIGGGAVGNALDNVLVGSAADEMLRGEDGNDTVTGGGGADELTGGAGADLFVYLSAGDSVAQARDNIGDFVRGSDKIDLRAIALTSLTFSPWSSTQTLLTAATEDGTTMSIRVAGAIDASDVLVTYLGPAPTIPGTPGDDRLEGTDGVDIIAGYAGNDAIIGGHGADTLLGGTGDDAYIAEDTGDVVTEHAGQGNDTVYTTVSYVLTAGSEVEALTVYERTTTDTLSLTGNALGQAIYGNDGANAIAGGGGADTLFGMGGNDAYFIDGAGDVVYEFAGGGTDVVYTTGSFSLGYSSEIEVISVEDWFSSNAVSLFGNALDQTLYGNAGNNALNGGGGADTLYGFAGDDSYVVDSTDDVVVEVVGAGTDTVYATGSYTLADLAEVEVLSSYERSDTGAADFTGSFYGQTIYGTNGVNFVNGNGGADVLYGLGGDDAYLVDFLDDQVLEFAGGGTDTVYAASHFVLTAGSEVEILTAYDRTATEAVNLAGNELANTIYGNAGTNAIDGKGGNDTIYLMGGTDTVYFSTALGAGNVDAVLGFASGEDRLQLDGVTFAGLAPGQLAAGAFVVDAQPADADDRLLYNQTLGLLFFDADGNGAGDAVLFATLDPGTLLGAGDFLVV